MSKELQKLRGPFSAGSIIRILGSQLGPSICENFPFEEAVTKGLKLRTYGYPKP